VGPRAGLDRCGKSRPHRSQSLYQLSYPAHEISCNIYKNGLKIVINASRSCIHKYDHLTVNKPGLCVI